MKKIYLFLTKKYHLLFIVIAGLLFNYAVPPFQNPDEPQHFGGILSYAMERQDEAELQKRVISFMGQSNWWKLVGMGKPEKLPENFSEMNFVHFQDFRQVVKGFEVYHFLVGKLLFFVGNDIVVAYYICRFFSLLFILGSVLLLRIIIEKLDGSFHHLFVFSFLFVLFLPQFILQTVSVNPDAFLILLSSLFFYGAVLILNQGNKFQYFLLVAFSGTLGFFTDKTSFILLLLLLLLPFFTIKSRFFKKSLLNVLFSMGIVVIFVSWVIWYFPVQYNHNLGFVRTGIIDKLPEISGLFSIGDFNWEFFSVLIDSFFLRFGWMAFSSSDVFYYLWQVMVFLSVLGLLIYVSSCIAKKKKKDGLLSSPIVILAVFFMISVILQLLSLWLYWGTEEILPQGRYMLLLVFPVSFLFIIGVKSFFDLFHKNAGRVAVALFILFEFFFLNYCIWHDMVPAFHMLIKSPHPGI